MEEVATPAPMVAPMKVEEDSPEPLIIVKPASSEKLLEAFQS